MTAATPELDRERNVPDGVVAQLDVIGVTRYCFRA
jgi:hypothetical protein